MRRFVYFASAETCGQMRSVPFFFGSGGSGLIARIVQKVILEIFARALRRTP